MNLFNNKFIENKNFLIIFLKNVLYSYIINPHFIRLIPLKLLLP